MVKQTTSNWRSESRPVPDSRPSHEIVPDEKAQIRPIFCADHAQRQTRQVSIDSVEQNFPSAVLASGYRL